MPSDNERKKKFMENKRKTEVFFNNDDYAIIQLIASKQGLKMASFVRKATLAQAKNLTLFPPEILDEFKRIQRILRGEATNINQMARIGNTEGTLPENARELILSILQKQEEKIHSLEKFISQNFKT